MGGKLGIAQLLVQRGVDVDSQESGSCTPLKAVSRQGHLEVVRFLIDSGADVNSLDREGSTPLHSASQEGHGNIVELLDRHLRQRTVTVATCPAKGRCGVPGQGRLDPTEDGGAP